MKLGPKVEN